jgi:hypothetical protein
MGEPQFRKSKLNLKTNIFNRNLLRLAELSGAAGLVVSQVGVMVNHPLTKSVHSFLHLLGAGSGLLLLIGLAGYTLSEFTGLNLAGLAGVAGFAVGLILFIFGNFSYAILHGLLNLVTVNAPVHSIPLTLAPLALSAGAFLIGLAALRNKTLSLPLAVLLMVSSLIFSLGWLQIGDSMQRQRNLSRYLKALLVVLPFGIAWFWFGLEQFRKRATFKRSGSKQFTNHSG